MRDSIFANEWMPSWEEKSAAATTYNYYSPPRKLTDDEMFEFCMSGIANVEDFIRSQPSTMFTSDKDIDTAGGQEIAANALDNEAKDLLAALTSVGNGAIDGAIEADVTAQEFATSPRSPAPNGISEADVTLIAAHHRYDPVAMSSSGRYVTAQNAKDAANPLTVDLKGEGCFNEGGCEMKHRDSPFNVNAAAINNPAQDVEAAISEPIVDTKADDALATFSSSNNRNVHHGYGYDAAVATFASGLNPLLDELFASMTTKAKQGGVGYVAPSNTSPSSSAAPVNVTTTSSSSGLVTDDAASVSGQVINAQISVDTEHALQATQFSDDDLFAGLGDFPDFPEFDDVAVSPATASSAIHDTKYVAAGAVSETKAVAKLAPTCPADVEAFGNAFDDMLDHSAVANGTTQNYTLLSSTTPPGTPSAYATSFSAPSTVGSISTASPVTSTFPKASIASSNTSLAGTQSATFSNKYASPFVSDEGDLFPAMQSFEDFMSAHSSPASNVAVTPYTTPAQQVVDLVVDTPTTAKFPAILPGQYPPIPAQPPYQPPMPTQPAYRSPMSTQQYHNASPYLNAAPYIAAITSLPAHQKPIWEMSAHEVSAWLASAGVPPIPGLESPHYASTELPTAPYTSPMPRKRKGKASGALPSQQPKKARVDSSRPIAQPHRRQPANGIPAHYSWLNSTAASTASKSFTRGPAVPVAAPPSSASSDPAPLLAFTIGGEVQGCTRVSDEQWAKMFDSAIVNQGKVRMRGGRWARLVVTGRSKVVEGVQRAVVAVVLE